MKPTNEDAQFYVEVPGPYIKDKAVDYDAEIYAAMGASLPIGGFLVRPPSLGVFSLLETYESAFIADPTNCTVMEFWRVLYINEHRRACLQEVMEWAYPDKGKSFDAENDSTWQTFDWNVYNWGRSIELEETPEGMRDLFVATVAWFNLAFEGFDMIPGNSGGGSTYWFGADAIGSLAAAVDDSIDRVLWDVPMCAIGHKLAAVCKQNGNEHIARKKDPDSVKEQCEAARERVRNGELHPWQLQDPENWPLTQKQVEYNDKLIDQWEDLAKEKRNGNK